MNRTRAADPFMDIVNKYQPTVTEYALLSEYNAIRQNWKSLQLHDVFVIPSAENPLHWFGVIFVKQGIYEGGVFRFHIYVDEDRLSGNCPKVVFPFPVFHPSVDPVQGYLDTKSAFPNWIFGTHRMWDLLACVKRALRHPSPENVLNHEAAELYVRDPAEFRRRAKESVDACRESLHDSSGDSQDQHYLRFSVYNENIHGTFRKALLTAKETSAGKPLSWIAPGSLEPCSASSCLNLAKNS